METEEFKTEINKAIRPIKDSLTSIDNRVGHLEERDKKRETLGEFSLLQNTVSNHQMILFGGQRPGLIERFNRLDERIETILILTKWLVGIAASATLAFLSSLILRFIAG